MRLTLKFLTLLLLLTIATFPNSGSMTTLTEEAGSPCFEGCANTEISCRNDCRYNQDCINKCRDDYNKCVRGCKPLAD